MVSPLKYERHKEGLKRELSEKYKVRNGEREAVRIVMEAYK